MDKTQATPAGPDSLSKSSGTGAQTGHPTQVSLRPEVFSFHDYREYLRLWFQYLKIVDSHFSLRSLAQKAGLSVGYLPSFLSGRIGMSPNVLGKIIPFLQLSTNQKEYLMLLRTISESENSEERNRSLSRLVRLRAELKLSVESIETYKYMSNWHTVAVRELANLANFQPNAKWIQSRLRYTVSLAEIQESLDFLLEHGFLQRNADGSVTSRPQKHLECTGGLYRVVLARFHTEILGLAQQAFHRTNRKERAMLGHTCAIPSAKMDQVRALLNETVEKIKGIVAQSSTEGLQPDEVYQIELACFPLTETKVIAEGEGTLDKGEPSS